MALINTLKVVGPVPIKGFVTEKAQVLLNCHRVSNGALGSYFYYNIAVMSLSCKQWCHGVSI